MDFVKELGDTSHLQDVLVDDVGRVEMFCGRLRITLCRMIEDGNGKRFYGPVIPLVWSVDAWRASHKKRAMMHAFIEGGGAPIVPEDGRALHH